MFAHFLSPRVTTWMPWLAIWIVSQHALKSGPEGRVKPIEWTARGGERVGETGRVQQRYQYVGIQCRCCRQQFKLGEMMLSHGNALVHPTEACQGAHDAVVAVELSGALEEGGKRRACAVGSMPTQD